MADTPSQGETIMILFTEEIIRRLKTSAEEMKAADFEMVRKFLQDQSITLASVRRGTFGDFAQAVAEEFPFDDNGAPLSVQ